MATKTYTQAFAGSATLITWASLANGDDGTPIFVGNYPDKSFQVKGTFGAGGSVQVEGSNDGGTTWAVLHDPQGNALAQTSAQIELISEQPWLIRPHVTAGDGTTSLTVMVSGVVR